MKKNYKKKSFSFTEEGQPGHSLKHMINMVASSLHNLLFKSFMNVLDMYPDALIVFRSFGKDIKEVLEYLKTNDKFKNALIGKVTHVDGNMQVVFNNGTVCNNPSDLNQFLVESNVHLALQEDYRYWNDHKRAKEYGKMLYPDSKIKQLFFDDNDCVNIIQNSSTDKLDCHYIKVNTLDALQNENYFTDIIKNFWFQNK